MTVVHEQFHSAPQIFTIMPLLAFSPTASPITIATAKSPRGGTLNDEITVSCRRPVRSGSSSPRSCTGCEERYSRETGRQSIQGCARFLERRRTQVNRNGGGFPRR